MHTFKKQLLPKILLELRIIKMKELSLNEIEDVSGGWLFLVPYLQYAPAIGIGLMHSAPRIANTYGNIQHRVTTWWNN